MLQSKPSQYGQSGKETEAVKEKYGTKTRTSSALFTARGTSERLSTTLKML